MRSITIAIALGAMCAAAVLSACDDTTTVNPFDAGSDAASADAAHEASPEAGDAGEHDAAETDAHDASDGD